MEHGDIRDALRARQSEMLGDWIDAQLRLGIRNPNVLAKVATCIARELAESHFYESNADEYWEIAAAITDSPDALLAFATVRLGAFDPTRPRA
jgi:hypothetical protein